MDNRAIARVLMAHADSLDRQQSNVFRRHAYRRAAEAALAAEIPLERIVAERGRRGLQSLPHIGRRLARVIEAIVRTGSVPVEECTGSTVRRQPAV